MRLRRYVAALTVENKKLSSAKQQHAQRFDVRICFICFYCYDLYYFPTLFEVLYD